MHVTPTLISLAILCLSLSCVNANYFDIHTCSKHSPCIHVSPNGLDTQAGTLSSPVRTIQQALNLVHPHSSSTRIVLQSGTYPGGIVWKGSSVTLTSVHGADTTVIDCNHTPEQHGIWIGSGETSSTVISGLTIQNCNATMGAGMAIVGPHTKPTLTDVVFRQNQATMGAGLFVLFASPTLISCESYNNHGRDGAGIYVIHNGSAIPFIQYQQLAMELNYVIPPGPIPNGVGAEFIASDLRVTGNHMVGIGSIFAQGANLVITRGHFEDNQSGGSGGIGLGAASHLTITDSSFINNHATAMNAGGIAVRQGSYASVTRCTFNGNSAAEHGGAIAVAEPGTILIADGCTFSNNKAAIGSIVAFDLTPRVGSSITNSKASGNVASDYGGIFFHNVPTARSTNLHGNTYENNRAPFGADYGSLAASVGFVDPKQSQIGDSTHSPSILPVGYTTTQSRTIHPLGAIPLRILIVDVFGQRITAPRVVNEAFLEVTPVTPHVPEASLLVTKTRIPLIAGVADTSPTLVGLPGATYAILVSTTHPLTLIPAARVTVTIGLCANPSSTTCGTCLNLA